VFTSVLTRSSGRHRYVTAALGLLHRSAFGMVEFIVLTVSQDDQCQKQISKLTLLEQMCLIKILTAIDLIGGSGVATNDS
jgi:hypothetical protein